MDPQLWDGSFCPISIFGINEYLEGNAKNITCSLYRMVAFIRQWKLEDKTAEVSQTLFSLYLHNKSTNFYKPSCAGKPQMKAICKYVGCTKATTNNQDIRSSVTIKSPFANILWMVRQICTIKLVLESAYHTISNNIWYIT